MAGAKTPATDPPRASSSDRRRWERTPILDEKLFVELRLPSNIEVVGLLMDLSPVGIKVRIDDAMLEDVLRCSRVAQVTVRSLKQVIFEAEATVAHVTSMLSGVCVGLNLVEEPESVRPRNLGDRRVYERVVCELPGTLHDGYDILPVVVTDISETGCRISGISQGSGLRLGALVELAVQPLAGTAVRMAARIVSPHSAREAGVRFVGPGEREIRDMVAALRYPDLVMARPEQAADMWEVLSCAGYLRERQSERYQALRKDVVACWSHLASPEATLLNRSVVSTDAHGNARSLTQVTRFYPSAWLGHHLAAAGDKTFRKRVVPQHHGSVHDTVESLGAQYFLVYYNAAHKGQTEIYRTLRERFPEEEMCLTDFACFDVCAEQVSAEGAAYEGNVRQVSMPFASPLIDWVHGVRHEVPLRALAVESDFELASLERAYARLGLVRRRTWFSLVDSAGSIVAAASVDIAPPGFNLTSIGNHATLYVGGAFESDLRGIEGLRDLLRYVGATFSQVERSHFMLLAPPRLELVLKGLGLPFMAHGQEFVVGAGMFRTLNTFINELYRERCPGKGSQQASTVG